MHPVEQDVRKWSHEFLEIPQAKLNGLAPCPYAKQAWLENKVAFSIDTGFDGLVKEVNQFDSHKYEMVIWASTELPDVEYLDGFCDGMNEALAMANVDIHLMVFHPEYDAEEAGLEFLVDDGVSDINLEYCMVFVQKLSLLDDASLSLEKSGYYKHFPDDVYTSLATERRKLRNAKEN
tara:strand:+ start:64 stop:597 length:534 start_codon:yes stop_codon:yes gene_type:complete